VNESAARYERRTSRQIVVIGGSTPVVAERAAVQRAVSCLLDNASKFDTSGSPIEVTVGDGGVAVADRGTGIPPAELPLVFERFHRAEEARTLPGSGLGLSIVREVARRHGGDAFARNRDGGGAVVGFTLGR
jgi:two-component system sensor histidine kinase MprB